MNEKKDPFGLLAFLHWNHDWNNWHFNEEILTKAIRQLQELGIRTLRVDILWSDVHAGEGRFDFRSYDALFSRLTEARFNVLGVLQYNKLKFFWNQPPDSFDEFANYVYETVKRYKGKVNTWEIWNEPNLKVYWNQSEDQLRNYSVLLKKSYLKAKEANPSCVVLNGGLTEPLFRDVKNLYSQGNKDYFDILNIHTFINPHSSKYESEFKSVIEGVRKIMLEEGDGKKKIWITEMGCPGIPKSSPQLSWFGGDPISEDEQANWLERQYELIQPFPYVEKLFWAFYRDTGNEFKDGTDFLGIVRFDLTAKPAYFRFKSLIKNYRQTVRS